MSDAANEIAMDATTMYQEDMFTDRKVGSIRRMTPVTANGDVDPDRPVVFLGSAQVYTPAGALPLNFELDADNLADAIAAFSAAAEQALEQTMEELKEMQRQAASSIVVPGSGGPGGQGGMPGGGLQIP